MSLRAIAGGSPKSSPRLQQDMRSPKKIQSALKTYVHTFGRLIISWKHAEGEVQRLLDKLLECTSVMASVDKTVLSMSARKLFLAFPDARDLVRGNIVRECEQLIVQVKFFSRSMQDTLLAMRFTADGAYQDIVGASCEHVQDGVFTVDHVLDIQHLYSLYSQVYTRD